jgi:hypothetical protein
MLVLIATATIEFLARQRAVRASWTPSELKQRARLAEIKQQQLALVLSLRRVPGENIR